VSKSRLVYEYRKPKPLAVAKAIYKNARPYIRSFNGQMMEITNPYQGKIYVRIARADLIAPTFGALNNEDVVHMDAHGDYVWDADPKGASTTSFTFYIVVHRDLAVTVQPGRGTVMPKEMIDGLKGALKP
jgi:hypothetical protein